MTRSLGQMKFFDKKGLKTLSPARPEVVISNNHAGIHFTLKSYINHGGARIHPNLKVIVPFSWLDYIHEDHDHNLWGHGIYGLPWYLHKDFSRLFPKHSTEPIKWHQIKRLRKYSMQELEELDIPVFRGEPILKKVKNGYLLIINNKEFFLEENTHFYNLYRDLITAHEVSGLPHISCTYLYSIPRVEVPKQVVLLGGNGRTGVWLAQHFPDTLFSCVTNGKLPPLFPEEEHPQNLLLYDERHYQLEPSRLNENEAVIIDRKLKKTTAIGSFYCSIGYQMRNDITSCVINPNINLTLQPSLEWSQKWVAPKKMPMGSLLESTLRWAQVTFNMDWSFELQAYHGETIIAILAKELLKEEINLPDTFCKILAKAIQKRCHSPNDEQVIVIYRKCFAETFSQPPDGELVNKCVAILEKMCKNRTYLSAHNLEKNESVNVEYKPFK